MPYTIRYDETLGIIELKTEATLSKSEFHESAEKVQDLCDQTGALRLLADTSLLVTPPRALDVFLAFSELPPDLKHALVVPKSRSEDTDVRFAEEMATHRGVTTKVFEDRELALKWLCEE